MVSFTLDGVHPHDIGTILDTEGVAVRTGHHCAMPVMEFFGCRRRRASFAFYNTREEVDALVRAPRGARRCSPRDVRLMDLKDLYREVIVDHNRNPRNFGDARRGDAPRGGSQPAVRRPLTVYVRLEGDRVVRDVRFEGSGCAISVASASVMTESVEGQDVAEMRAPLRRRCTGCSRGPGTVDADALGKLAAFSGVHEFPARVKCASLCWHTLERGAAREASRRRSNPWRGHERSTTSPSR